MPAKSKQQQKFFGVVKAMQSGDIPKKGGAGKAAKSMSKKEVDKYASTKHKGLPKKVKQEDIDMKKTQLEALIRDEITNVLNEAKDDYTASDRGVKINIKGGYKVADENQLESFYGELTNLLRRTNFKISSIEVKT